MENREYYKRVVDRVNKQRNVMDSVVTLRKQYQWHVQKADRLNKDQYEIQNIQSKINMNRFQHNIKGTYYRGKPMP